MTTTETDLKAHWRKGLIPPPKLSISDWADQYRKLSMEASSEPGDWSTDRAPYQREMMNVIQSDDVYQVVVVAGSQLGKSEFLNNAIGYHIHLDPQPILFLLPSDTLAEEYSKERIAPMIRDCPVLRERVSDPKTRDSSNTILKKMFPGGHLTLVGANTPRKLASKPIGKLFMDEVDGFVDSAGTEGDPISLAKKRTDTFPNKKWVLTSTPLNKTTSRIRKEWLQSDQRYFYLPCVHCGDFFRLTWELINYDKDENGGALPETAYAVCPECGCVLTESDKATMLSGGEWRATAPFKGIAGFHISTLYSPFKPWLEVVRDWVDAYKDPQKLKVFTNTQLAEWWEETGERVSLDDLYARREEYPAQVPDPVFVLTAGVDVQKDCLKVLIKGWGIGEESWDIDYLTLYGDPNQPEVWRQLDSLIGSTWKHQSGTELRLSATCIDTGGHHTQMVYDFCEGKTGQRIFAIKGVGGEGVPIVGKKSPRESGSGRRKVDLFPIGVDQAKSIIHGRLKRVDPGAGCFHFPMHFTSEYFSELTAEEIITVMQKGFAKREWRKIRPRNEAFDCNVYAYAGLKMLAPNWEEWRETIITGPVSPDKPQPPKARPSSVKKPTSRRVIGRMY